MYKEYQTVRFEVDKKLSDILSHNYHPEHISDILKECVKLLKPFAYEKREVINA